MGTEPVAKRSQEAKKVGSQLTLPAGLDSKCPSIKPQAVLPSKGTLVMNSRQFGSFLKTSVENPYQRYSYRLAFFYLKAFYNICEENILCKARVGSVYLRTDSSFMAE